MRLFGIVAGASALGASILVGLATAAAVATTAAKGAAVGVVVLLVIATFGIGVAAASSKIGH